MRKHNQLSRQDFRGRLFAGAAIGAALSMGSSTALAQAAASAAPAADTVAPTAARPKAPQRHPSAAAPSDTEIVVTATRRATRLQNTPIAVTAISSGAIQARRIENFRQIVQLAPGPTYVPVKGPALITVQIRGQETANDAPGLENPIGIYIDDIYYGTLASFDANLFDVSQIAILRGPQGTTFGRNAVGGALQITNNLPQIGVLSGRLTTTGLSYEGGHGGFETDGYVNAPLSDKAAARLAYSFKDDAGYQHNVITGHDLDQNKVASVRGSVLWDPNDQLHITASAAYSSRGGNGDGPALIGQGAIVANVQKLTGGDLHNVALDDDGRTRREIFAGVLHADYQLPYGTLSSITGFRSLYDNYEEDSDGGPLPLNAPSINTNEERQVSEEIRFVSNFHGPFDFVSGLFAGYEDLNHGIQFNFNGKYPQSYISVLTKGLLASQYVDGQIDNRSVGPYFEGTYKITQQLKLTAGIRYSYEQKSGYTKHVGSSPFYGGPYSVDLGKSGTNSWDSFTPRAILSYTPVHDILFYGSVSKGFQGGGWVLTAPTPAKALVPLQAETTWSYEVGTKSSLFHHFLTADIAAFYADTTNLQVRSLSQGVLTDSNAGDEQVKGVEFEGTLHPTSNLSFGLNYAYTDAHYATFVGCAAGNVNCSGNEVPFTPRNDLTVLADYTYDLPGDRGELTAHFDDKFASGYQLTPTDGQQSAVPLTRRTSIGDASITYTPSSGRWNVRAWSTNIFNKDYINNGLEYNFYQLSPAEVARAGGLGKTDVERLTVAPPRAIGLTFNFYFGG